MKVVYKPGFLRQYRKLPDALKEEVKERIALLRKDTHHPSLHVHKLKGDLRGTLSLRVNYKYRIVFEYETRDRVTLLAIGDHRVYE